MPVKNFANICQRKCHPAPSRLRSPNHGLLLYIIILSGAVLYYVSIVHGAEQPVAATSTLGQSCTKNCSVYEKCFLYNNVNYCAPYCAPGRCDNATETCILQGISCEVAPCIPIAICEPKEPETTSSSNEVSSTCNRICPMVNAPVCGSDGVSYANTCFFQIAQCSNPGLQIASRKICDYDLAHNLVYNPSLEPSPTSSSECENITCANITVPVCTTIGTMKNLCFWKKARCERPDVELVRRGPCDPSGSLPFCPSVCTQEYAPVCGSNGKLYENECFFRQANCANGGDRGLVAKDMSFCELSVGDSTSSIATASNDLRTIVTSVFN